MILLSYRSEKTFAHPCGRGEGQHWQKPDFRKWYFLYGKGDGSNCMEYWEWDRWAERETRIRDVGKRVNEACVVTHKQDNHLKGLLAKIYHSTHTFSTSAFLYGQAEAVWFFAKVVPCPGSQEINSCQIGPGSHMVKTCLMWRFLAEIPTLVWMEIPGWRQKKNSRWRVKGVACINCCRTTASVSCK